MARRVRLDVRWDEVTVELASRIAERRGVRSGVVMREAVAIGLSTLANGGDEVRVARTGERMRVSAVASSGGDGIVPAAGSASSRAPAGAPVSPSGGAGQPATRLEAVVARILSPGLTGMSAPAPVDLVRARKLVLAGGVLVGGRECRNPTQLVAPVEVTLG